MSFNHSQSQRITKNLLPALYLIWAGLILGVSFIATPVKFQASNLTMPVALEVGKATFHLFNNVEWVIIAACAILTIGLPNIRRKWLIFAALAIVLIAQTFWLLPALDIRADAAIAGSTAKTGHTHWIYISLETLKMLLVMVAAWFYSRKT